MVTISDEVSDERKKHMCAKVECCNEYSPDRIVEERKHERHRNEEVATERIVKPNLHSTQTDPDCIREPTRIWHCLVCQRHVDEPKQQGKV